MINKDNTNRKNQENEKTQESNEFVVLEGFNDATYFKGRIESELESRVIKYGNQPTDDGRIPDIRLLVRSDVDKRILLKLLDDLGRLIEMKIETEVVSEQSYEQPYGIFTFPYPDASLADLMIKAETYFCTCSAEFPEPCTEEPEPKMGHSNIISQYD